jgi:predicted phosphodiesterase
LSTKLAAGQILLSGNLNRSTERSAMHLNWTRLAVISDIHSNLHALEAALQDADMNGCDAIVDLGDCVSGPLFPRETAALIIERGIPSVRGNHERQLSTLDPSRMGPSDAFAFSELTDQQKQWIAARPATLAIGNDVLAVHGIPGDDLGYLMETVEPEGCRPAMQDEVERRLAGATQRLILCGHTHLQREMHLPDARQVVNPGSIGLPAYADDNPFQHRNEAGSPHARYAIIMRNAGEFTIEMRSIAYDWGGAAELAARRGRLDWVTALRTGRA